MLLGLIYSLLYFLFVFLLGGTRSHHRGMSIPPCSRDPSTLKPPLSLPLYSISATSARISNGGPRRRSSPPSKTHRAMAAVRNSVRSRWCAPRVPPSPSCISTPAERSSRAVRSPTPRAAGSSSRARRTTRRARCAPAPSATEYAGFSCLTPPQPLPKPYFVLLKANMMLVYQTERDETPVMVACLDGCTGTRPSTRTRTHTHTPQSRFPRPPSSRWSAT